MAMYNTAGYDPGAFLTNLKNNLFQKYNQQMGASGGAADIGAPTASQASRVGFGALNALNPEEWIYRGASDAGGIRADERKFIQNLTFDEAKKLDRTNYSYDPKLSPNPPTTKLGQVGDFLKYAGTGLRSLTGEDVGPIGGGTPTFRKAYETVVNTPVIGKALKNLPIAGNIISGVDAVQRAREGDYGGAALSGLGALPGLGGLLATGAQYATDALGLTGQEREEGLTSLPEVQPTYTYDPEQLDYYDDPENNTYINHMGLATFGNRPISSEPLNYNVYDAGSAGLPVYAPDFTSADQANKFYGAYRFYNRNNPELLTQYGLQY